MSLNLNLPKEDLQKLSDAIEKDGAYETIKNKMRAAVLICTQDLMNNSKASALQKFNLTLPENQNIRAALAAAADFLKQKQFIHTLSVLQEEVKQEDLEAGENELDQIIHKNPDENALQTLISTVQ
ncbi:hypothetical protein M9Y10_034096 [Tritrichomonas musculus]|uniref:Uncharacterized protein n=1 Tax=Tritrichomonas musculus TaxID=1915356 RepID=A0ABR2KDY9_9EUKA